MKLVDQLLIIFLLERFVIVPENIIIKAVNQISKTLMNDSVFTFFLFQKAIEPFPVQENGFIETFNLYCIQMTRIVSFQLDFSKEFRYSIFT